MSNVGKGRLLLPLIVQNDNGDVVAVPAGSLVDGDKINLSNAKFSSEEDVDVMIDAISQIRKGKKVLRIKMPNKVKIKPIEENSVTLRFSLNEKGELVYELVKTSIALEVVGDWAIRAGKSILRDHIDLLEERVEELSKE